MLNQVIAIKDALRRSESESGNGEDLLGVLEIQQIGNGTPANWRQMWQSAEERGHRGESSQRTTAVHTCHDGDDDDDDNVMII